MPQSSPGRVLAAPQRRAIKRLLTATAELQEVLGDHQVACVAEQRIRELLDEPANDVCAAFVAGRLVERERHRAAGARAVAVRVEASSRPPSRPRGRRYP